MPYGPVGAALQAGWIPVHAASNPFDAGSGRKKGRAMSPGQCVDGCGDRDAVLQPFEVL